MLRTAINIDNKLDVENRSSVKVSLVSGQPMRIEGGFDNSTSLMMQMYPDRKTTVETNDALSLLPQFVPPNIDIRKNILVAQRMNILEFIDAVKTGGMWDFKKGGNKIYEAFGNWHFGVVARAFGFPEKIALMGAGLYQMLGKNTPGLNLMNLITWPHGDDEPDSEWIILGGKAFDAMSNRVNDNDRMEFDHGSDHESRVSEPSWDTK